MAEKLGCSIASVERYRSSIKRKIFRIVEGSE
jgi:DNA-binding CsgD family transcriptional regulator